MKKFNLKANKLQRLIGGIPQGLTLVELMISIAIVSIMLTAVGPNIQSILISNRITADVNNLSSVMRYARHAAVNDQTQTVVCPTSDYADCESDWKLAKMVFVDSNGNGSRDETETLAVSSDPIAETNRIIGISGAFTFAADGSAQGQTSTSTITLCHEDNDAKFASALLITTFGKITVSTDSNNDGTREDASGDPLSCS